MGRVVADQYYGDIALNYERERSASPTWHQEHRAVESFVRSGPVLDVPLGTGRFVSIYRAKGLDVTGVDISDDMLAVAKSKHAGLNAIRGSILDLPFDDQAFATAVCMRMLYFFDPREMAKAIAELRRLAGCLVVAIRHGVPASQPSYTHSLESFYQAIDGMVVENRCVIYATSAGVYEVFDLRRA